ncbi:hypothetical protein TSUD_153100 [Trifolium subterraneum]|uniref:Uncharacterized protein n=1 Tax=Trifolium subterraneum TaxID=3900 RepID=A0A2Z6N0K8_TRISU|nr:hypothetical protein TSUD_153100 [Trifolium subterraneum]
MAEMAVSFAIDKLLPLLTEETKLLRGVHKEFSDIKDELESIQAFLKDADKRAVADGNNTGEGVKIWVRQLREAAFQIEDIIDNYMMYVEQQPRNPGCAALLNNFSHLFKTLKQRHQIASGIRDIKSLVSRIMERSQRYGFQRSLDQGSSNSSGSQNAKLHPLREDALYIDEADVVGFEAPKKTLIDWMLEGGEDPTVISVVGMGGQGKTTLVKKVFDNKDVIAHFDCRVWITVSQTYDVEKLLRDMLLKLYKQKGHNPPQNINQMDQRSLTEEVRNYLKPKRYVVVFDDVWSEKFWNDIKFAVISDNKRGKKLIGIATEIVQKCKGLPLAIVAIGGLLSRREKNEFEWQRFSEDLKDYQVKSTRVIRQWIAEGFVKEERGKTLEEVAEGYLTELIHRSLVQASSIRIDGKANVCCVHDQIREMILEKFEDLNFCMQISEVEDGIGEMTSLQTLRSVGLYTDGAAKIIEGLGKLKQMRDLRLYGVRREDGIILSSSINEMQHLEKLVVETRRGEEVLEVIDLDLISLPTKLRKLTLKGTLQKLPEWIPKLQNLVELRLWYSRLTEDPLKSLNCLQHLLSLSIEKYDGWRLHFEYGWFQKLKELKVRICTYLREVVIDKGALPSLKKLNLNELWSIKNIPTGIQHLEKLEVLIISYMPDEFVQKISTEDWNLMQHVPLVQISGKHGILIPHPRS